MTSEIASTMAVGQTAWGCWAAIPKGSQQKPYSKWNWQSWLHSATGSRHLYCWTTASTPHIRQIFAKRSSAIASLFVKYWGLADITRTQKHSWELVIADRYPVRVGYFLALSNGHVDSLWESCMSDIQRLTSDVQHLTPDMRYAKQMVDELWYFKTSQMMRKTEAIWVPLGSDGLSKAHICSKNEHLS